MAEQPDERGRDEAVRAHISARALGAGVAIAPGVTEALARYLAELARWNRKINLTALALEPATDAAIDRLLIEPLVAAAHAGADDRLAIDIGSGGGSPAIPFTLAVPHLQMVMVETKSRKCAFLRAVIRELGLHRATVENCPLADFRARFAGNRSADIVTVRAVRAEPALIDDVAALLRPAGRLLWFGGAGELETLPSNRFELESRVALPSAGLRQGKLTIHRKVG